MMKITLKSIVKKLMIRRRLAKSKLAAVWIKVWNKILLDTSRKEDRDNHA